MAGGYSPEDVARMMEGQPSSLDPNVPQPKPDAPTRVSPMSRGYTPEEVAQLLNASRDETPEPQSWVGTFLSNVARKATFETADEMQAGAESLTGKDYDQSLKRIRAQNKANDKANPWGAALGGGVGMALSVLPFGRAAQGAGLAARMWNGLRGVTGGNNMARALGQEAIPLATGPLATVRNAVFGTQIGQGGIAAAKYGALERLGDTGGEATSPTPIGRTADYMTNRISNAFDPSAAAGDFVGGAVGTGVGNAVMGGANNLFRLARRAAEEGERAAQIGSRPALRANQEINQRLLESRDLGRPLSELTDVERQTALNAALNEAEQGLVPMSNVRRQVRGGVTIDDDIERGMVDAYQRTIQAGGDDAAGRVAAAAHWRALNPQWRGRPVSDAMIERTAGDVVDAFQSSTRTPLLAPEVLVPGGNLKGTSMGSLTQGVMNESSGGQSALARAVEGRQQGALGRTRELVSENLGDADYLANMERIQGRARTAQRDLYDQAWANAQDFSLAGPIRTAMQRAEVSGGRIRDSLQWMGNQLAEWETRMAGRTPAEKLRSFRQMRTAINEHIEGLASEAGGRESARALRSIKSRMDAVVGRRNRDWWAANGRAADDFAVTRAADRGRNLNLNEGADMQEARRWYRRDASEPEREAFRLGLSRKIHDQLVPGDMHDVSKIFNKGGDQFDEGIRGLLADVLGEREARIFMRQINRERVARQTWGLNKNSNSGQNVAEQERKRVTSMLGAAYQWARHPLSSYVDHVAAQHANNSSRLMNEHLGRVLSRSTQNPAELRALIAELRQAGLMGAPTTITRPYDPALRAIRDYGPSVATGTGSVLNDRWGGG
jgi:hypothetical protein